MLRVDPSHRSDTWSLLASLLARADGVICRCLVFYNYTLIKLNLAFVELLQKFVFFVSGCCRSQSGVNCVIILGLLTSPTMLLTIHRACFLSRGDAG